MIYGSQVGMNNSGRSPVDSPLSAGSFEWGYVPEAGQPSTADLIASQSQDYIDERLQEFQATIVQLQSEYRYINNYILALFTFCEWHFRAKVLQCYGTAPLP